MIDALLLAWIFAQAAASPVATNVVSAIIGAVLASPVTLALVRYADNRAKQRDIDRRALIDAEKARHVAEIQADAATRRAEEEEETGRHLLDAEQRKLEAPMAERFAHQAHEERRQLQEKYDSLQTTVRDLDGRLAGANERVRIFSDLVDQHAATIDRQTAVIREQALQIIQLHGDLERLVAWVKDKLPEIGEPPVRQPTPANGIDIARIPVARRDPRRE